MTTETDYRPTPPADLDTYSSVVEGTPVDFDAGEGYPEQWDYAEAARCEDCGAVIIDGDDHGDVGGEVNGSPEGCPMHGEDSRDLYAEGPMMNYVYPLPEGWTSWADEWTDDRIARALVDFPLCVVRREDGGRFLALTGGGMDLSWEIVEAYAALGLLPPAHFCRLPKMAGRGESEGDRYLLAVARESLTTVARWARSGLDSFDRDWPQAGLSDPIAALMAAEGLTEREAIARHAESEGE